jgi:hypothetical protein
LSKRKSDKRTKRSSIRSVKRMSRRRSSKRKGSVKRRRMSK